MALEIQLNQHLQEHLHVVDGSPPSNGSCNSGLVIDGSTIQPITLDLFRLRQPDSAFLQSNLIELEEPSPLPLGWQKSLDLKVIGFSTHLFSFSTTKKRLLSFFILVYCPSSFKERNYMKNPSWSWRFMIQTSSHRVVQNDFLHLAFVVTRKKMENWRISFDPIEENSPSV